MDELTVRLQGENALPSLPPVRWNKAEVEAGNAKGSELDVNYAVEGVSVPFHPGAEKYFKEAGALS